MQFWAAFVSDIVLGEEASKNSGQRPYSFFFLNICFCCAVLYQAKLDCALIDISVIDSCVPRVAAGARPSWTLVQIVFKTFLIDFFIKVKLMKYYKIHLVEIKSNRKNYNLQRIRNQSYNVLEGGKDESEWRVARRRGRAPWTTNFSGKHRTYFLFCALSFECIIFVLLRKFPYGT